MGIIDKRQVIYDIERCISHVLDACRDCSHYTGTVGFGCMENLMSDTLVLLKEQNWIECSDRMPEERDSVFAKFKGTDEWQSAMFEKMSEDVRVVVVFEDGTRRVHHSYTVDGEWEVEKKPPKRYVTHWMPNPELP